MPRVAIQTTCCSMVLLVFAIGCGTPNPQQTFDPVTGHPVKWAAMHGTSYLKTPANCKVCHGDDLRGGISGVSCYSASFKGLGCHPAGPSGHFANWSSPGQHGPAAKAAPSLTTGFASCQICHGTLFDGMGQPNKYCGGCHGVNAPHPPRPWRTVSSTYTHTTTHMDNAVVCALCHLKSGTPGCFNNSLCHADGFACGTCHSNPPSGNTAPNRAGKHVLHLAFNNVTCATCHNGAGSGTVNHINGIADVTFPANFNAKTGSAVYNRTARTCGNVSCHGGQTTPNWYTGTIAVDSQCRACHGAGTAQFNGYFSGHHSDHINENVMCIGCHGTVELSAAHFSNLQTQAIEAGTPAASIKPAIGYNSGTRHCSTPGCHGAEDW